MGARHFTDDDLKKMAQLRAEGWSYPKIGREFGLDHSSIIYFLKFREPKQKIVIKIQGDTELKRSTYIPTPPVKIARERIGLDGRIYNQSYEKLSGHKIKKDYEL